MKIIKILNEEQLKHIRSLTENIDFQLDLDYGLTFLLSRFNPKERAIRQSQETKQRGLSPNIPCPTLLFYV